MDSVRKGQTIIRKQKSRRTTIDTTRSNKLENLPFGGLSRHADPEWRENRLTNSLAPKSCSWQREAASRLVRLLPWRQQHAVQAPRRIEAQQRLSVSIHSPWHELARALLPPFATRLYGELLRTRQTHSSPESRRVDPADAASLGQVRYSQWLVAV
jgi:hypothetical protein